MSESRARPAAAAQPPRALRLVDATPTSAVHQHVDTHLSGLVWARRYRDLLRTSDTVIVVLAIGTALITGLVTTGAPVGNLLSYSVGPIALAAIWLASLAAFHTRGSHTVGVGALEYKRVTNATALAFGLFAIGCIVFTVDFARIYFLVALPLGLGGVVAMRWLCRKWLLRQRRFGHYLARAIIVGDRADAEYVAQQVEQKSGATFVVVGAALDGDNIADLVAGDRHIPVISDVNGVAQAAAEWRADTVIVAGPRAGESDYIRTLGWSLEGTATELVLSSRLTDVAGPRIHFRPVEGLPLIHVEIPTFEGWKHVLKRTFDVVFAVAALLVLAPALVVIGLFVHFDSHGPVLFRQERCGRNGRTFQMVKFRSMVATAEDDLAGLLDQNEANGVLFKLRNDPRVTRVGRLLRKYSLDELPQIWNVLNGDMSIVGPRPPLRSEVDSYEKDVHRRLFIKPGITGLWQISGRSDLSWEESVRLDLYYVENWSLTGDIMIIWRTFKTILKPVGAY
ncbi:sugar transferase [Leifsonia sp. YIM 134122]|uniref:Sugar transferase n=1 Tax=Leifsonia stereocauli TaxID=3134136 RepID=A0ABU9WAY4_9MICO